MIPHITHLHRKQRSWNSVANRQVSIPEEGHRRTLHLRSTRVVRLVRFGERSDASPPVFVRDTPRVRVPQIHHPRKHVRLKLLHELRRRVLRLDELGRPQKFTLSFVLCIEWCDRLENMCI